MWNLWLQRNGLTKTIFHPCLLLLFLDPGSEIRDPGSGMGKNQDPGSWIRDKHPGSATLCRTISKQRLPRDCHVKADLMKIDLSRSQKRPLQNRTSVDDKRISGSAERLNGNKTYFSTLWIFWSFEQSPNSHLVTVKLTKCIFFKVSDQLKILNVLYLPCML